MPWGVLAMMMLVVDGEMDAVCASFCFYKSRDWLSFFYLFLGFSTPLFFSSFSFCLAKNYR